MTPEILHVKACSHDLFLRIRFLVPKIGSRRSDGPNSRFRFCGEDVGRSFVVWSHDPFFRTNKESSIWRQNDHAKFVGAFHLSRRVSDENRACSISIRFFKITDPCDGRSFLMCSHGPFFGTNKNHNLKNGLCEQAFKLTEVYYYSVVRISALITYMKYLVTCQFVWLYISAALNFNMYVMRHMWCKFCSVLVLGVKMSLQ